MAVFLYGQKNKAEENRLIEAAGRHPMRPKKTRLAYLIVERALRMEPDELNKWLCEDEKQDSDH